MSAARHGSTTRSPQATLLHWHPTERRLLPTADAYAAGAAASAGAPRPGPHESEPLTAGAALRIPRRDRARTLVAADSLLVLDGAARGWERHARRFTAACAQWGVGAGAVAPFLDAVVAALPRERAWFPRMECLADRPVFELRLRLRAAPERRASVRAWVDPSPDDRRHPRIKGPELASLGARRARAVVHGGEEALLADAGGRLLEGAYSNLLWWEGDVLYTVPDDAPILAGVTRALVLEHAAREGVAVGFRRPLAAELDGREAWLTSALHGIRAISAWVGADAPRAGAATHASAWRAALDARAEPLGR